MSDELKELEYYDAATYKEMKSFIHARQATMARSYIAIGFYLRRIRDEELFRQDGYADIHAFALDEYGMQKSTVNHCMRVNEQFSKDGRSPVIDERYRDYSKTQLQEMLYLSEEKREKVTPDMTVKQIRGMKDGRLDVEPNEQIPGQMNVYDFPEFLPEESASVSYSRQEVPGKAEGLEEETNTAVSDQTDDTSDWPEVEEEPVEIEAECMDDMDALPESQRNEQECCQKAADGMVEWNPLFIRDCLETEERNLKDYHTVEGLPFAAVIRQEALVIGLRQILSDAESVNAETDDETEEYIYIQPNLPILKNNDQRKEWLRNYKDWGLWYEDEHIGCKYYKYEFENGAMLIAETYMTEKTEYCQEHESCYLHLIGGPPCRRNKYGQIKYQTHRQYNRFPNSETELVEFLKEVQKK